MNSFTVLENINSAYRETQPLSKTQHVDNVPINLNHQGNSTQSSKPDLPILHKVPNVIDVLPEQQVLLSCIVENLGDQTVCIYTLIFLILQPRTQVVALDSMNYPSEHTKAFFYLI